MAAPTSELVVCRIDAGFDAWRDRAREMLEAAIPPERVLWSDESSGQPELFGSADGNSAVPRNPKPIDTFSVPRDFLKLAKTVACHSDSERWSLLYRVLWRMTRAGERHLLSNPTDPNTRKLGEMAKAVRRDCHKMHAFVRFNKVGEDDATGREQFVAWFEPTHHIVEYTADFFVKRFTGMDWSILTPQCCLHWDGIKLHVTDGVAKDQAPDDDALESLWLSYYRSIFNPARLKLQAMQAEMPKKYWKNLPEAPLIEELTREAGQRSAAMVDREGIDPRPAPRNRYLSDLQSQNRQSVVRETAHLADGEAGETLDELKEAASGCRTCPLWERSTQTVFGEGNPDARVMLIGEQPGDEEDLAGRPFVGPAGKLLDQALAESSFDRSDFYITNAVKHFKWKPAPRGKRRLHDKANRGEIQACRPWLIAEVLKVKPEIIVTLGSTAAQAIIRPDFAVMKERGRVAGSNLINFEGAIVATVHPSFLLRLPDPGAKREAFRQFVSDLNLAR